MPSTRTLQRFAEADELLEFALEDFPNDEPLLRAAAERAMTDHMATTARTPWRVEVYRMMGWDDDGRGAAYQVAGGDGTAQDTLF